MPTVILNHRVKDYETWKPGFDSDEARRTNGGAKLLAVGEKVGDPGNVYIVFDVADMGKMQEMMADPELQAKMQEMGVISAPELTVLG